MLLAFLVYDKCRANLKSTLCPTGTDLSFNSKIKDISSFVTLPANRSLSNAKTRIVRKWSSVYMLNCEDLAVARYSSHQGFLRRTTLLVIGQITNARLWLDNTWAPRPKFRSKFSKCQRISPMWDNSRLGVAGATEFSALLTVA